MNKELFGKVLKIPPNERFAFAEYLYHEDDQIRHTWGKEVNDRIKAVKKGQAKLLDYESLYNAGYNSLIKYEYVTPAEAGIQKNTGFRVKPGMTHSCKFMSLCIILHPAPNVIKLSNPDRSRVD